MEDYDKIKYKLSVAFIQFVENDEERLTDEECFDIDDAFDRQDWKRLGEYIRK